MTCPGGGPSPTANIHNVHGRDAFSRTLINNEKEPDGSTAVASQASEILLFKDHANARNGRKQTVARSPIDISVGAGAELYCSHVRAFVHLSLRRTVVVRRCVRAQDRFCRLDQLVGTGELCSVATNNRSQTMIGLSLLALLAPAAAASGPADASTAKPAPNYLMAKEEGKVVCRRVTEAHSRISTRICRTELQWEEMARQNQEELRSSRHKRL